MVERDIIEVLASDEVSKGQSRFVISSDHHSSLSRRIGFAKEQSGLPRDKTDVLVQKPVLIIIPPSAARCEIRCEIQICKSPKKWSKKLNL